MRRFLALDLSLTASGYARSATKFGTLEPPKGQDRGVPRINWIMRRVLELADGVDLVVIEGYSFGSSTAGTRSIAELGGLVRWALWRKGIEYVEVPPSTLKKYATGKGNAGKEQVLTEAVRRLGYVGHSNDEADALWLWTMAADHYGLFSNPVVPKAQREAIAGVPWPAAAAVTR